MGSMKSSLSIRQSGHDENVTQWDSYRGDARFPRSKFPESSSGQEGAGWGRLSTYSAGQVPETSSGQVMTAEKQIINR